MTRIELLNEEGNQVFFTNPIGRLNSITIKKERVDDYIGMQDNGWVFIRPMKRVDLGCAACEG